MKNQPGPKQCALDAALVMRQKTKGRVRKAEGVKKTRRKKDGVLRFRRRGGPVPVAILAQH